MDIERASFECPWDEGEFTERPRERLCMVAELDDEVVGYMVYDLHETHIFLASIAVAPEFSGNGIGSCLLYKLKSKLMTHHRRKILAEVRETNLNAQLFFRDNSFLAVKILRDHYEGTPEDAYLFRYVFSD